MAMMHEGQSKAAPGSLALIQDFVNTQYGHKRRAHVELAGPDDLRNWLVRHDLLARGTPVTEEDFRRVVLLREAVRDLLRVNSDGQMSAAQLEALNALAGHAPLAVRFQASGQPALEPQPEGVDGAIARLVGIVFTAMVDGSWLRLKVCRNEPCQKAFYDTSKNRSGEWCSMAGCGSRVKARAYRDRHAADGKP